MARKGVETPLNTKASFKAYASLRTVALITTSVLILNKVPSLYALASVITRGSAPENALQMTMHTYSLLALIVAACLLQVLRKPASPRTSESRPLSLILLAHVHVIDFILGVAFTILFANTWFKMIAHPEPSKAGPGAVGMDAAAGVTSPETPVESVIVGSEPAKGTFDPNSEHTVIGIPDGPGAAGNITAVGSGPVFGQEGAASMVLIGALWMIRAFMLACIIIYARGVARDAESRGIDVMEKHGWLDMPGYWLCKLESRFWLGPRGGLLSAKRNRRPSGASPRDSIESNKEWQ